jgi:hypothetical protein
LLSCIFNSWYIEKYKTKNNNKGDQNECGKKELLCIECRKRVSYHICKRPVKTLIKDSEIEYEEYYGICDECKMEIYLLGLDDQNEEIIEEAYRKKTIIKAIGIWRIDNNKIYGWAIAI